MIRKENRRSGDVTASERERERETETTVESRPKIPTRIAKRGSVATRGRRLEFTEPRSIFAEGIVFFLLFFPREISICRISRPVNGGTPTWKRGRR